MQRFSAAGKQITVYPSVTAGAPLVVLNTFGGEGSQVYDALRQTSNPSCTLAVIGGLDWGHDMAPWDCPPLAPGADPCTGGADEYLELLLGTILPEVESRLSVPPAWRGIAGYSLGGLFALYALYRTDLFARAASVSGSLWYPGLPAFVQEHAMLRRPDCLYFSVGDRECRTRNPYLQTVQQNTELLAAHFQAQGIRTKFVLNPGGHGKHAARRTADGIFWMLNPDETANP